MDPIAYRSRYLPRFVFIQKIYIISSVALHKVILLILGDLAEGRQAIINIYIYIEVHCDGPPALS